ncbi:MAG TPA: hypothetical protein HA252_03805 [Candidatus Diapherotrites archaeon]|uniref:Uncharacterized protein n=1 Tax=Candidatus Iainarchaeum sp. TaxID=3101447 RepID=A0A7J4JFE5_9ARCH|nr:hypothetical protein [Candidatus Diapherotrites archaeon]HIH16501.1 hypothetical protein [Candidatus Diapherotrites archaeon]
MTRYGDWFFGNLAHNLRSPGFQGLVAKTAAFLVVEFALLYSMYVGRLEHPVSSALFPILQQSILFALFCLFSWKLLRRVPRHTLELGTGLPFLVVALLGLGYRFSLPPGTPLNRVLTGLALVCLFVFIYGLDFLRHLLHKYQKQVVYTAIAFIYFLYVINVEGEVLARTLNLFLWPGA